MGFVFQTYNLLPVLTAQENVELPLLISGYSQKAAKTKALESLSTVNLVDWSRHRPSELSGGQQQRVALARALVNDPAIVWADEPTGNLDSQNEREIMELITRLNKENGQTFILVTHSDSVGAQADRPGYIVGDCCGDQVLRSDHIRLDGLERVVLTSLHLFQCGGVDDHVEAP